MHLIKEHNQHIKDHTKHKRKQIKQIILNMERSQLNKTHKGKFSNKLNMAKILKQTWETIKHNILT